MFVCPGCPGCLWGCPGCIVCLSGLSGLLSGLSGLSGLWGVGSDTFWGVGSDPVSFIDATREFQSVSGLDSPLALVNDVIYADDSLILSLQPRQAESFMSRVLDAGSVYGLALNCDRLCC